MLTRVAARVQHSYKPGLVPRLHVAGGGLMCTFSFYLRGRAVRPYPTPEGVGYVLNHDKRNQFGCFSAPFNSRSSRRGDSHGG